MIKEQTRGECVKGSKVTGVRGRLWLGTSEEKKGKEMIKKSSSIKGILNSFININKIVLNSQQRLV